MKLVLNKDTMKIEKEQDVVPVSQPGKGICC